MTLLAGCAQLVDGSPAAAPGLTQQVAPTNGVPTSTGASESSAAPTGDSGTDAGASSTAATWPELPTVDPTEDAGADVVTDEQVGLLPDATMPDLTIIGGIETPSDVLAVTVLQDLFTFYTASMPTEFGMEYVRPENLISYDSSDPNAEGCGESLYEFQNAFFAAFCDAVAWDRGVLLPSLQAQIGVLAPAVVLSHEIGHDVQNLLGEPESTSGLVLEQQADCYAGAYWRWVADGNSAYYAFNQTEGMRQLLLSLLAVKDPPMMRDEFEGEGGEDNHGNGFDRTYAAALGYANGIARCSQMDQAEIDARIQEFPFDETPYQYGNIEITVENIAQIVGAIDQYFTETQPGYVAPTLAQYQGAAPPNCGATPQVGPAAYCPETNTVSFDLAALQELGTPAAGWESPNGDFSAFMMLASRYALAAQYAGKAPVTGTSAGLQALCYVGTWARWMRNPHNDIQLSPNDLDKAIYQIIVSPDASSDMNGQTDASILDRMQAFGFGVTTTISSCFKTYIG